MRLLLLLILVASVGCVGDAASKRHAAEIMVAAVRHGDECLITVGDRPFVTEKYESKSLVAHLRSLKSHAFFLRFDDDTPYRCIGSATFALQRAKPRFRAPQIPTQ